MIHKRFRSRPSPSRIAIWLAALTLCGLSGCRQTSNIPEKPATSAASKQYSVRGNVISVDVKDGVISLDTDAIPGFMEAMTMAYSLQDPSVATELHPGDRITAQLQISPQGAAVLSEIVITQQANPNARPAVETHIPQPGDLVPNFTLLNQSNQKIHLHQFRDQVLVVTFVFTRCSFAEYCPLMSRNFAALHRMFAADPQLAAHTHLLTISFDPEHDTPAVLRRYGSAYAGGDDPKIWKQWDFAAPSAADLASLLQWFNVGVTEKDGTIQMHSVSTAIIRPDGKIAAWYPSNDWTPQQALHDVQQALAPAQQNYEGKHGL